MKNKKLLIGLSVAMTFIMTACSSPFLPNKPKKSSRENEVSIPDPVSEESSSRRSRSKDASDPNHEHKWSEWVDVTPATCTQGGYQEKYCDCGETKGQYTSPLGHDFDNGVVLEDTSDCQTYGVRTVKCSRCSEIKEIKGYGDHRYENLTKYPGNDDAFSAYSMEQCKHDTSTRIYLNVADSEIVGGASKDTHGFYNLNHNENTSLNWVINFQANKPYEGMLYQKAYLENFSDYGEFSYADLDKYGSRDYNTGNFSVSVNGQEVNKRQFMDSTYAQMTANGEVLEKGKDWSPVALCPIGQITLIPGINSIVYTKIGNINMNISDLVFVAVPSAVTTAIEKYGTVHAGTEYDPLDVYDLITITNVNNYAYEYYFIKGDIDLFIDGPKCRQDGICSWVFKGEERPEYQFRVTDCVYKTDGSIVSDDDLFIGATTTVYGLIYCYNNSVVYIANSTLIKSEGTKPDYRTVNISDFDTVYNMASNYRNFQDSYNYYSFSGYVSDKAGDTYFITKNQGEAVRYDSKDFDNEGYYSYPTNAIELNEVTNYYAVEKLTKDAYVNVIIVVRNVYGTVKNARLLDGDSVTVHTPGTSWPVPEPPVYEYTLSDFVNSVTPSTSAAYIISGRITEFSSGDIKDAYGGMTISDGTYSVRINNSSANVDALVWNYVDSYEFNYPNDFFTNPISNSLEVGYYVTMKVYKQEMSDSRYNAGATGVIVGASEYDPNTGWDVNFNCSHCHVEVYLRSGFKEQYLDTETAHYSRDSVGNLTRNSGIAYFKVICDEGYEFYTGNAGNYMLYSDQIDFINGQFDYLRYYTNYDGFRLSGINSNITINLTATRISQYNINISYSNCNVFLTDSTLKSQTDFVPNSDYNLVGHELWLYINIPEGYELDLFSIIGDYAYYEQYNQNVYVIRNISSDLSINITTKEIVIIECEIKFTFANCDVYYLNPSSYTPEFTISSGVPFTVMSRNDIYVGLKYYAGYYCSSYGTTGALDYVESISGTKYGFDEILCFHNINSNCYFDIIMTAN